MDVDALNGYIRQEIRRVEYPDRTELYLPFAFGGKADEPLCLTWDREGVLTDGGRTLDELKKRVGDIDVVGENIQNILHSSGNVRLEGGQKLVVRNYQTVISGGKEYTDYLGGLDRLIRVISLISVSDSLKIDKDGTVIVC